MHKLYFLTAILLFTFQLRAQTYQGAGGTIHDDGRINDFVIDVQGLDSNTLTPAYGLREVCINVTHTWISDLDIRLVGPDGTTITLTSGLGGDGDFYTNTCFDMQASTSIINGQLPFTGSFRPFSNIGNNNNGQHGNGPWTLRIVDTYAYADGGDVLSWSLTFGPGAPSPEVFDGTNLPIFIIHTDQQWTILNEPKIDATLKIIRQPGGQTNHLTDPAEFEGNIGIEVRGASSQGFPKKSYGFETRDAFDIDTAVSLLGLPEEEDWILYAPYTDKTFLRDALTYQLGREVGQYAPRTVFGELFLNGDYQGVYCLEEKIKRDKNRVNIAKLKETDLAGDSLTGGYILKVDRDDGDGTFFLSQYEGTDPNGEIRVVYEDPKGPDMHPLQRAYIQGFYHDFEDALFGPDFMDEHLGYRRYVDVRSFAEHFIISELGQNVDAYRLSTYLYKDRDDVDSLLHLGPLWDFNLAYGNADYCGCQSTEGWTYLNSGGCGNTPVWWPRLLEDPYFQNEVKCRYEALREDVLSTNHIFHYLDSMAGTFAEAQVRNYAHWPILGTYVWPNYFIGQSYEEEVNYLKQWIHDRLQWLDDHLPGECIPTSVYPAEKSILSITPNPADQLVTITFGGLPAKDHIKITAMNGKVMMETRLTEPMIPVEVAAWPSGMYAVRISGAQGNSSVQKLIVLHP